MKRNKLNIQQAYKRNSKKIA